MERQWGVLALARANRWRVDSGVFQDTLNDATETS